MHQSPELQSWSLTQTMMIMPVLNRCGETFMRMSRRDEHGAPPHNALEVGMTFTTFLGILPLLRSYQSFPIDERRHQQLLGRAGRRKTPTF